MEEREITDIDDMELGIAVIGMSGRFPGAGNIHEFWQNLKKGIESVTFFSGEELEEAGTAPGLLKNPNYIKAKSGFEGIENFDAWFFGCKPGEAQLMDPQVRIFLECSWASLEDAGYDPRDFDGLIGIYAGASPNYSWEGITFSLDTGVAVPQRFFDKDYLAPQTAYRLNLQGPVLTLHTACSTSLLAIHLACQGLISGECHMALAGGVSISLAKKSGYLYTEGLIVSPDGHCRAFDARANGTIFGDGTAVVVLKSIEEAVRDRDHIYAVIRGSAVNNDGNRKVAFTAPSTKGQADVIKSALAAAEIEPESIGYIEAHGTGTTIGDPIEIEALKSAFASEKKGFCAIGSLKSNMGHLDAAAGAAGLIKAALSINHGLIVPSLHFETPNPKIDFENSPFYINKGLKEWKSANYPLRAGVSSFGVGGTNVHIILEESPGAAVSLPGKEYQLLLLSAKTETALDKMTLRLAGHFKKNPGINLADAAYTLLAGRSDMEFRKALVLSGTGEAVEILSAPDTHMVQRFLEEDRKKSTVFMFPGQGSQYVNMGWDLYRTEPIFRREMDSCFEMLKSLTGCDIKEILYPGDAMDKVNGGSPGQINRTEIAQPSLFCFEYALAKLLIKWGIKPAAMIGHSIGEYTAACLAGVFSLEDALKMVTVRGKLMQQMPTGAMLSVQLPVEELEPILDDHIATAAVNHPSSCVVSAAHERIDALEKKIKEKHPDIHVTRLHTSHAFHSSLMDPVVEEFKHIVRQLALHKPMIPFISNVTGEWITGEQAVSPEYWAGHLRQTVHFSRGVTELLKKEKTVFLEVGPGNVLISLVRKHLSEDNPGSHLLVGLVRHPRENQLDDAFLLDKLGYLWLYGKKIDGNGFYTGEERHRIPLPTYPFEGQPYWPGDNVPGIRSGKPVGHSLLRQKKDIKDWFYIPSWKRSRLLLNKHKKHKKEFTRCCLVFADTRECSLCSRFVERLHQEGAEVILVSKGSSFKRSIGGGHREYTINPAVESDYDTLIDELRSEGKKPLTIVHFWNVTGNDSGALELPLEPGEVEKAMESGFYSLLSLARAMGKHYLEDKIQVTVISDHMQEVTGEMIRCPQKALLLGPVMVIPKEYPNIMCRSIDIIKPEPGTGAEDKMIENLAAEIITHSPDVIVAYRSNTRWVRVFEPITLETCEEETRQRREQGVYLVTGGLGGIGMVLAEYLTQQLDKKAKLVLTGRSSFPPPKDWDQWLETHPAKDSISLKIGKIREWEASGADVLVLTADVSHGQQLQEAIRVAEQKFGAINGVIHSAGLPDAGLIQARTRETSEQVFAAKVTGTLNLASIMAGRPMDFFILCSSLAAVLAPIGQVAYTSANAFLDSFAGYSNFKNGPAMISINWDTWREVGMAVNVEKQFAGALEVSLETGISPGQGKEMFERILDQLLPQVVISARDLETRINEPGTVDSAGVRHQPAMNRASSLPKHQRPRLKTRYAAPVNKLEKTISRIWQDTLGLEQVGIDDNFFDLGATSLDIVQVNHQLKKVVKKNLPVVILYNYPTIAQLARYLLPGDSGRESNREENLRHKDIKNGKSKLQQRGKRMEGNQSE